jgi:hypothetical protein
MVRAGAPSTTLVVAGFKVVDGGPSAAMTMMPDQAVSASGRRYKLPIHVYNGNGIKTYLDATPDRITVAVFGSA